MEVKVLIEGKHERQEGKVMIGSTVVLIKNDKNIIVDTGSFLDREKIIEELKKQNLTPEDIDIVILTHLHLDHLVNVDLFNKAKVFCKFKGGKDYPGQYHVLSEGYLTRTDLSDGAQISKGVSIIHTPGHSSDMISVVVETDKGKIVITGDAISDKSWVDLNKKADPISITNSEEFDKNRKKI
jgi:glyoxylase-like metal-dependent hydrolase (beta-lactamase superfamily II)